MVWPVEIFCCYAREDLPLLTELKKQLMPLLRQGLINLWSDTDLSAGEEWEKVLHQHLNTAHILLLLISTEFIVSDYCYSVEMKKAIERHEQGEARVIPIILNYVDWQFEPLNKLQALPTGAKPITSKDWLDQNEALFNVAQGIKRVVMEIPEQRRKAEAAKQARLAEDERRRVEAERARQEKEQADKLKEERVRKAKETTVAATELDTSVHHTLLTPVKMPRLGESIAEGTIGSWLKNEGDWVEKEEALAEIIPDKINADLPSPVAGRLTKILVKADETVPVGADLAVIEESSGFSTNRA